MSIEDLGLLFLRAVLGIAYIAHGARKVGLGGAAGASFGGFRDSIARRGFRPATVWAGAAVGAELAGGVLVLTGLLTPIGGALLLAQSLMIVVIARPRGFWHDQGGVEYPLLLVAAALTVGLVGPGSISLDAALGLRFDPALALGAALLAVIGTLAGLASRRPAG